MRNELIRSDKEQFLDKYFSDRLQSLINLITKPELEDRDEHLCQVFDIFMGISDEYESVMLDKEEGYWQSLEMWNDECDQRQALEWVNSNLSNNLGNT